MKKETIELVKKMIEDGNLSQEIAEKYCPELNVNESEDERIRKALIKLVKKAGEGYENVIDGVSIENAIAWLEKQGELVESNEVFNDFVRWFVGERTKNYTLIPSDEDIQKWGNMILEHARKVLNNEQKSILDVEIPFGAKDSELEEVSYSIPNGYHAEIEDNKVVIKKDEKKSSDKTEPKFKVGKAKIWIARDRDGALYIYNKEPLRAYDWYYADWSTDALEIDRNFHPEITWGNSPQQIEV